jgi:hypothetical protein
MPIHGIHPEVISVRWTTNKKNPKNPIALLGSLVVVSTPLWWSNHFTKINSGLFGTEEPVIVGRRVVAPVLGAWR